LINSDFELALKITDSLMVENSDEPLFPFLRLCILRARDLDFDRIIDSTFFFYTYNMTIKKISEYEASYGKDSYSQTLKGYTYVTYASYHIQNNQLFNAVGWGMDALKMFRKLKKVDSTNYDIDFLLGFYNFTKAELRKKFWFVLFWFPGSKKKGIESIKLCSERGSFTRLVAKMSLIDIYIINSEYEKSKQITESLLEHYPESRFILWSKIRYYKQENEYKKCAETYAVLSNSYQKSEYGDYNMLNTRLKQIECLKKSKQNKKIPSIVEQFGTCKECFQNDRNKKICQDINRYSEK
jgi:tetratricopeptide (TPR) repeat protein